MNFLRIVIIAFFVMVTSCSVISTIEESFVHQTKQKPQNDALDYSMLYYDKEGIHWRNSSTDFDTILVNLSFYLVNWEISPDKRNIAISYSDEDSTRLIIFNLKTKYITPVHTIPRNYFYTYHWDSSGQKLAIGYFNEEKVGNRYQSDKGKIFIYNLTGYRHDLGCSVSKYVVHWLPNNQIAVKSGPRGKTLYLVSPENCTTIEKIDISDKKNISFSPAGDMLLYTKQVKVIKHSINRVQNKNALYISDDTSQNEEQISGILANSQNFSWAPNGEYVVFQVESKRWANTSEIAFYDVKNEKSFQFENRNSIYGVPNDYDPVWSPDSKFIVFDREFLRGDVNNEWYLRQKVTLSLNSDYMKKVDDDTYSPDPFGNGNLTAKLYNLPLGNTWGWITDTIFVSQTNRTIRFYNTDEFILKDISPSDWIMYLKIIT